MMCTFYSIFSKLWLTIYRKISGFRRTMHFTDETRKQWNDIQFIAFQLVLASEQPDMYLPKMAPDVETREHGWRW